jgi:diguanylate cyclase (GGDEF)-like protein
MKEKRFRSSKRNFILALALLLTTNILMAMILSMLAKKNLREQIKQRMLDISNTAAYMLNGDELEELKAADKGTESYNKALDILRAFQENIELDYIYSLRAEDNGSFTFIIDPDTEDPGEFGENLVATDGMISAAKGNSSVDKEAHTDVWGTFYSAYSPVFNSEGKVAGIVGVDFDAEWYDGKLSNNRVISIIITMCALTVGIILSFIIMSQNRKRFTAMLKEVDQLDLATHRINEQLMNTCIKKLDFLPDSESEAIKTLAHGESGDKLLRDDYDEVTTNLRSVYKKLDKYVSYVDANMYKDELTNTYNKAAYKNTIRALDERIKTEEISFSVAFFDLNGLESINAHYGFEAGDVLMFHSARILKNVFGKENVFRVAGDEFIAIMEEKNHIQMGLLFEQFEEELNTFNNSKKSEHILGIAKGSSSYTPDEHENYRHVFIEARKNMKKDKELYYQRKNSL